MKPTEVVDKLLLGEMDIEEAIVAIEQSAVPSTFRPKTVTPARVSLRKTLPRPPTSGSGPIKMTPSVV